MTSYLCVLDEYHAFCDVDNFLDPTAAASPVPASLGTYMLRATQVRLWKVLEDTHLVFRPVGGGSIDCVRYVSTLEWSTQRHYCSLSALFASAVLCNLDYTI